MKYLRLLDRLARLRPVIIQGSPPSSAPGILPEAVASYIAECLELDRSVLACIWQQLSPRYDELEAIDLAQDADDDARTRGKAYSIGTSTRVITGLDIDFIWAFRC